MGVSWHRSPGHGTGPVPYTAFTRECQQRQPASLLHPHSLNLASLSVAVSTRGSVEHRGATFTLAEGWRKLCCVYQLALRLVSHMVRDVTVE